MLGGLATRKLPSLSLLLIFAMVLIFMQNGWFIGVGLCSCCGSSCYYYTCPTEAQIEQGLWNKEAYEFLYCDDCFPSLNPHKHGISGSNQPENGTTSYWMDKGNNSYLAGSYEQAEESYAEAVKIDPSLMEGC